MSEVYIIKAGDRIKIGFSRDVQARLSAIQCGSSEQLELLATLPGDHKLERTIHRRLCTHHCRGEWYADNDEVRGILVREFNFPIVTATLVDPPPVPTRSAFQAIRDRISAKLAYAAQIRGTPEHLILLKECLEDFNLHDQAMDVLRKSARME